MPGGDEEDVPAITTDISAGGLRVLCRKPIFKNFRLLVSTSSFSRRNAVVAWSREVESPEDENPGSRKSEWKCPEYDLGIRFIGPA
jgi:hypothetical protein